ncbi:MAG: ammonium transporter [Acidimicrobiia bacterium]|nr:ammonium transporter [Acidimicrobiia bacterium]
MKRRTIATLGAAAAVLAVTASPVDAQIDDPAAAVQAALDNAWVVLAGVLVFVMQAGFALLETGLTRVKNTTNILAKNLADMCIGVVAFLAVGYALAFGAGNPWWGTEGFFLAGTDLVAPGSSGSGNISTAALFFFQAVFAAAAVTIASGAMAERTRFKAYLLFSATMTAFVYPMVVHWTWGGGFIADISINGARFSDFAGSAVVHGTGGAAALAGAVFLGPRLGKYTPDGRPRQIAGHATPMVVLGVFILWLGWFGFNAGSQLAATAGSPVTRVIFNTALAGAAGTLAAGAVVWRRQGQPDMAIISNGTLAGLVSITAGCASMNVLGTIVTASLAGALGVYSMSFIERKRIDDPIGAVSVHGVCGFWGTLAVGLFARYDDGYLGRDNAGLFYGGGGYQLVVQLILVAVVAGWVLVTTGALFAVLRRYGLLRVSPQEEALGLDLSEHGIGAYPEDVLPRDARAYQPPDSAGG